MLPFTVSYAISLYNCDPCRDLEGERQSHHEVRRIQKCCSQDPATEPNSSGHWEEPRPSEPGNLSELWWLLEETWGQTESAAIQQLFNKRLQLSDLVNDLSGQHKRQVTWTEQYVNFCMILSVLSHFPYTKVGKCYCVYWTRTLCKLFILCLIFSV